MHAGRACILEPLLLWLLLAGIPSAAHGRVSPQRSHRVIVRFAGLDATGGERELLEQKVQELRGRPGVLHAKGLYQVGLAVAACSSLEAEEALVEELELDPSVALATPDTRVYFDGAAEHGGSPARSLVWPLEDLRECSAQSGCAALGLVGNCCPASDGLMLACCDGPPSENLVAFRTFHGKYVVAEDSRAVNANRDEVTDWEAFHFYRNDDGTISLRTFWGTYVGADYFGGVGAESSLIGAREKFWLVRHEDDSVSLRSFLGLYVVAEQNGMLNANRLQIGDWERFRMIQVGGPSRRFPNDANFTALWGLHSDTNADIDAPEAWKTFTGEFSAGITVAVIDSGIDYAHEDLAENMWVNPGEIPGNGIDDDGNGYVDDVHGVDFANEDGDPMDDQMHGTHCAGTIAGVGNNGAGVAGVAWHGVRLMALKFLASDGSGATSNAVEAIDYAVAHGARITSNSWGGGGSNAALRIAIERAEAAGVLFIAAAGNSGTDNDEVPHYPSTYPTESIIAVASFNAAGNLSDFSCYGASTVDLAAPGSSIYSTVPNQGYKYLSGTSMATPHVTGLAALIWMYRPGLSMMQVKEILLTSVERTSALEGMVSTGGHINAMKALEAASSKEAPHPPRNAPLALNFTDVSPKIGLIAGTVTITAALDESDVEYYKVYFVSGAGYQLDAVGNATATGARHVEVSLEGAVVMPKFAVGFVAVSGNATGEMPAQIGGHAPNFTVTDFAMPEMGPQVVSWEGDLDLRQGVVAGKLLITRAADESSISHYNVYWSNASGSRGTMVGSIVSAGFLAPSCTGQSCSDISRTNITGGYRFDRTDYHENEEASITLSGPGTLKVTRFDTERFYDSLLVGTEELTGHPDVPQEMALEPGTVLVRWYSDDSVTATGWTFEIFQSNGTAQFQLPSTSLLGRGLEVVAAHQGTERPDGIFVELVDYDRSMPPSPAFAPEAISFSDVENATGLIGGLVEVTPASGSADQGIVTYYQLDFADSHGRPLDHLLRAVANGSSKVRIPIAAIPLPLEASKLLVRAGNAFGLGVGQISTDIVDLGNTSFAAISLAGSKDKLGQQGRPPTPQDVHASSKAKEKQLHSRTSLEPWLQQPFTAHKRDVIWQSNPSALSTLEAGQSRVRAAVTVPGLTASAAQRPEVRQVFQNTIAAALPQVRGSSVTIRQIVTAVRDATKASASDAHGEAAGATTVNFEVLPSHDAPSDALDRIESRLILLSLGGRSAERFDAALLTRLSEIESSLEPGTRTRISEPQQLLPETLGRKLAEPLAAEALAEDAQSPLYATLLAGPMATLAVALILALRHRTKISPQAATASALTGVRVEANCGGVEHRGPASD